MSRTLLDSSSPIFNNFSIGNANNNGFLITTDSDDDADVLLVDQIEMLSYNGVTTYTFVVLENNDDNSFRNLVLRTEDDVEFQAYMAIYHPTEDWLNSNQDITPFQGQVQINPYTGDYLIVTESGTTTTCTFSIDVVWECDAGKNHPPGTPADVCNGGAEVVAVNITEVCYTSAVGGSNPDNGIPWQGENGEPSDYNDGPVNSNPTDNEYSTDNGNNLPEDGLLTKPKKELCEIGYIRDENGSCVLYDDYQILNELTGKALCVYNKLKSSSNGFKNAIKKFEPEFPVAHLKFDMGDIGASRGRTIAPNSNPTSPNSPDFVITVRLNNNSTSSGVTQRPNLLVAKTIAHEVIHAEMYRKLLSVLDSGGSFDGVTREDVLDALSNGDFPGIYDYFRRHKNWQHQQMATHYRESLARILQEYDTGVAVPDSQQPSQLYMDLAWEGLKYPSIHTWSSLPQTEKDRINDVISNYVSDNLNQTCTE